MLCPGYMYILLHVRKLMKRNKKDKKRQKKEKRNQEIKNKIKRK